jgi:hypothetical protein
MNIDKFDLQELNKGGSIIFITGKNSIKKTYLCIQILKTLNNTIKYGKVIVNNKNKKYKYINFINEDSIYTNYSKNIVKEFCCRQKEQFKNRENISRDDLKGFLLLDCSLNRDDITYSMYRFMFTLSRTFSITLIIVYDYQFDLNPLYISCIDYFFILNDHKEILDKICPDKIFDQNIFNKYKCTILGSPTRLTKYDYKLYFY